jgi:putative ABC transport system permease protein
VANLLLARAADRAREIAIRASLGASRMRLIRQLSIESLVLACAAGVLGLVLSIYFVKLFSFAFAAREIGSNESSVPFWVDLSMDWRVFSYLAALCAAASFIFGLAPAFHLSRVDLHPALSDGARGVGASVRARRWAHSLVIVELSLAMVLLVAGGLLVRSVVESYRAGQILDTTDLTTMQFTLAGQGYASPSSRQQLLRQFDERLASNRDIASATLASNIPFIPGGARRGISLDGRSEGDDSAQREVTFITIDSSYFRTLDVPIIRGRDFTALDAAPGQDAVIINQRLATAFFDGGDPIGRRIHLTAPANGNASAASFTIVGVSPTVPQFSIPPDPGRPPAAVVYAPLMRPPAPPSTVSLIVRGRTGAANVVEAVRQQLRALDPDVPLYFVRSMDDAAGEMGFQTQGALRLFGFFAVIAFVLAVTGLYAVTAHGVTQRTGEIGVRMAFGAQRAAVLWLFLRRTLVQVSFGLALGLLGSLAAGRLVESSLVQTSPRDAFTLASVAILLGAVSIAAALIPARRAARLDPAVTLRCE